MEIQIAAQKFYEYSLHLKGFSKQTIKRYKYVIDSYCKISKKATFTEVSQESVRDVLFYGRTQRSWSSNTVMIFYKSLMVFFRWCKNQKIIEFNPVEGIDKIRIVQKLPVKLTKQDAFRLLEIVENYPYQQPFLRCRNHAIFAVFIFAGLRKNELLHLKYNDVDLQNQTIFIRQGKGQKDRLVPIAYSLKRILEKYIKERNARQNTCPHFFNSLQNNRALTEDGLKHLLNKIIPVFAIKFSFHKLRHTFATLMLEGGCDIYSLSKMMGHSDIKTTAIYLSASAEHLKCQIQKHPLDISNKGL